MEKKKMNEGMNKINQDLKDKWINKSINKQMKIRKKKKRKWMDE